MSAAETQSAIVDKIGDTPVAVAQRPVTTRNYIHDRLGILSPQQVAAVAAAEDTVEGATGQGVAVETLAPQPGKASALRAFNDALTLNVKGSIAAIIWLARSPTELTFNVMLNPGASHIISNAQLQTINTQFTADLRRGDLGGAIVSAVNRTAAAIEAAATPLPASASPPAENATPGDTRMPQTQRYSSSQRLASKPVAAEWILFFAVAFVLVVVMATASARARIR